MTQGGTVDGGPGRKGGASDASATTLARLVAARDALVAATDLAWAWHGPETRKGRATSYLSHLLAVQGLVVECGGGPDEAIAALLHDALEDAPTRGERSEREARIRARFGEPVLRIVLDCTDTLPDESAPDKRPWRERKERFLASLARADRASHLVVACDKRHNLGDLVWDLHHEGPPTFARFNAGPAEQLWYFESVTRICARAIPPRLALELDRLLGDLRTFAAGAHATERIGA
ncbi:MAG: HD domain-containing protein [Myxococcota bacterium]